MRSTSPRSRSFITCLLAPIVRTSMQRPPFSSFSCLAGCCTSAASLTGYCLGIGVPSSLQREPPSLEAKLDTHRSARRLSLGPMQEHLAIPAFSVGLRLFSPNALRVRSSDQQLPPVPVMPRRPRAQHGWDMTPLFYRSRTDAMALRPGPRCLAIGWAANAWSVAKASGAALIVYILTVSHAC